MQYIQVIIKVIIKDINPKIPTEDLTDILQEETIDT